MIILKDDDDDDDAIPGHVDRSRENQLTTAFLTKQSMLFFWPWFDWDFLK